MAFASIPPIRAFTGGGGGGWCLITECLKYHKLLIVTKEKKEKSLSLNSVKQGT